MNLDIEWPELAIARLTYPSLTYADQGGERAWLMQDCVQFDSRQSQGHFTFRMTSNRYGRSLGDHLASGRTHGLMGVRDVRFAGERDKHLRFLFMVDLRRALLCQYLANEHVNARDGTPFLLYDVMTPGVERFCERLRTSA